MKIVAHYSNYLLFTIDSHVLQPITIVVRFVSDLLYAYITV